MPQQTETLSQLAQIVEKIAPYMDYAVYVALGVLAITLLAFCARMLTGACNDLMRFSSRLLIVFGGIFLVYQIVNVFSGAAKHVFHNQPYWLVAAILLLSGIFFRLFATLRPTRECA